jgi:hypothetical protein
MSKLIAAVDTELSLRKKETCSDPRLFAFVLGCCFLNWQINDLIIYLILNIFIEIT